MEDLDQIAQTKEKITNQDIRHSSNNNRGISNKSLVVEIAILNGQGSSVSYWFWATSYMDIFKP